MKIAILDDYQDAARQLECYHLLREHDVKVFTNSTRGLGQLAIRLAPFEAIVLIRERTTLARPLLAKLPNLRLISQTGKVSGHIDVEAATAHKIAIAEGVGSPVAPAELTWTLIMAASRKIVPYANNLKDGLWQTASINPVLNGLGSVLRGRTLAIWGYGKIGRMVAGYGKAFGMQVLVWGGEGSRDAAKADGFEAAPSREEFFARADVLSLHLRLADATRGMVTAADLARMKPTAALHLGRPGSAALDVFESEPLAASSPLLRIPTVLATPHLGYVEKDSYELYLRAAFENIVNFAAGTPSNILNPAALD